MAGTPTRRRNKRIRRFRLHALAVHPFCQWCQSPLTLDTATADHLVPRSRGGTDRWENLCLACGTCNLRRRDDLPQGTPLGPRWSDPTPPPSTPPIILPLWVAWTRYVGGRWRRSFRGTNPDALLRSVRTLMGGYVEAVILAEGREPEQTNFEGGGTAGEGPGCDSGHGL